MTPQQLQIKQMAEQFLSWDGNGDAINQPTGAYEQYALYNGADPMVDMFMNFNGDTSAKFNQIQTNRSYTLTLTNGNAASKTVMLLPGVNPPTNNLAVDGVTVAMDGSPITLTGNPGFWRTLQKEIAYKPHNVIGSKVVSDSALIETGNFRITQKSAFWHNDKVEVIEFSHYIGDQNRDKLIFIDKPFQLGDITQWEVTLPPNSNTVFSLFFGASVDTFHALKQGNRRLNAQRAAGLPAGASSTLLPASTT